MHVPARRRKASAFGATRPSRDSYLKHSGADHPRARSPAPTPCIRAYGFLSENARFAEILIEHGVQFIGPKPEHIPADGRQDRGQKRTAQRLAFQSYRDRRGGQSRPKAQAFFPPPARSASPVLVKAAAGGGGPRP